MTPETRLAQLLCARFCHDISGSLGTMVGALDLVAIPVGDDEALSLAREAAGVLRDRLMVMRALCGSGPSDAGGLAQLIGAALAERRTVLESRLGPGLAFEPAASAMVVAAALLGGEALPRGGTLSLEGGAAGLAIRVAGRNAHWPATLPATLAGAPLDDSMTARHVLGHWLAALAAGCGWRAALGEGEPAALLLMPG